MVLLTEMRNTDCLERQDLSCTELAHHELKSEFSIVTIFIVIIIAISIMIITINTTFITVIISIIIIIIYHYRRASSYSYLQGCFFLPGGVGVTHHNNSNKMKRYHTAVQVAIHTCKAASSCQGVWGVPATEVEASERGVCHPPLLEAADSTAWTCCNTTKQCQTSNQTTTYILV